VRTRCPQESSFPRPSRARGAIALVLASALATAPFVARAAPAASPAGGDEASEVERARELFYQGSARYSAADYTAAIDRFTEALEIVTRINAEPKVRGALLLNLAKAHVRAYDVDEDVRHLRAAREILRRFQREADDLAYDPESRAEAEKDLAAVEVKLERVEAAAAAQAADPSPAPAPAPDVTSSRTPSKRRIGGFVLVGLGAAVAAASIGPFVYAGAVIPKNVEAEIEKKMPSPDDERDFRKKEDKKAASWFAVGGVMIAAGIGLVAGGTVLLIKPGKNDTARRLRVTPLAGPTGAGFELRAAF